jgi:hypothetical protein
MSDPDTMRPLRLWPDADSAMALERSRRTDGLDDGPQQERVVAVIKDDGEAQEIDIAADRVEPVESVDGTQEQLVRDIIGGVLGGGRDA